LKEVAELCKKHNALFICDEVQTGLGRTGANLCHLREGVRPDLVVLGKALAGGLLIQSLEHTGLTSLSGMYALSGVLGDDSVMGLLDPFE
jgi:ornithine--oxo-acid transaminase